MVTSVNGHNNPRYTILDTKSRQNCSIFIVKIFLNFRVNMVKSAKMLSVNHSVYTNTLQHVFHTLMLGVRLKQTIWKQNDVIVQFILNMCRQSLCLLYVYNL